MIAWSTSVLCRNGTYGRIKVSIRKADVLARGRVMNGAVIRVDGAASAWIDQRAVGFGDQSRDGIGSLGSGVRLVAVGRAGIVGAG